MMDKQKRRKTVAHTLQLIVSYLTKQKEGADLYLIGKKENSPEPEQTSSKVPYHHSDFFSEVDWDENK